MDKALEQVRALLPSLSDEEGRSILEEVRRRWPHPLEKKWSISADSILSAIDRGSDLTKRGVRGVIAEAVFHDKVLTSSLSDGWEREEISPDLAYDALARRGDRRARIQVKLQRLEKGQPKNFHPKTYGKVFHVVEVQKTRTGTRRIGKKKTGNVGTDVAEVVQEAQATRPYSFDDFDILAVNLQPSTGDWTSFRYTLSKFLLAREKDPKLIEIMQPVSVEDSDVWTSDLNECLEWFVKGEKRQILSDIKHRRQKKTKSISTKRAARRKTT